ncbi:rifin PIR protein, putative [Plasmodium reichenowi]|uniref:Rifin PIR protein, putative n=1 Tax=Plasmodium reichenowi TaxID=5854 RepID=A0A2P9DSR1_PLARE|nr:rifin PIR protein, putative [Plasmodium reichenowi]
MKVHYINILFFALPLNILEHNKNKSSIIYHKSTTRLLCECELYSPANYDNDPQMKRVMQQFEDRTSERLREYDERLQSKRMQCKEQCDKEIQKIILKDKLEKQMEEQLTTLQTDIQSDAIPTCVCEKSLADKVEKVCLRCGGVFGGGVMPAFGTIGGTALYALNQLKPAIFKAAIKAALKAGATEISTAGTEAGQAAGMKVVSFGIEHFGVEKLGIQQFERFLIKGYNIHVEKLASVIDTKLKSACSAGAFSNANGPMCTEIRVKLGIIKPNGDPLGPPGPEPVIKALNRLVSRADAAAAEASKDAIEGVTATIKAKETVLLEAGFNNSITSIYTSIIAILIIVLIMVIIYLILRYRRKKKMKKKLQYIKLLEE